MIEIGRTSLRPIRRREKGSKKLVPVLDAQGQPEKRIVANEVVRVTRKELDGSFGRDRHRKLVVKLKAGDVLEMWPQGTRQKVTIEIAQVYRQAIHYKAQIALLEKARARKVAKANARAQARMHRAEARLLWRSSL